MASRVVVVTAILLVSCAFSSAQLSLQDQSSLLALINAFPALATLQSGPWIASQRASACVSGQTWEGLVCSSDTYVTKILLPSRGLVGALPSGCWQNFTLLTEVDFSNNMLTGGIPVDLFTHLNIVNITLAYNNLNQPFPEAAPGYQLRYLHVQNNSIPGNFTDEMANHPSLQVIDVSSNKMSGTLPDRFFMSLLSLRIAYNKFYGTLPLWYSSALYLTEFVANNNELSGDVQAMTSTSAIRRYVLSHNPGLTGCLSSPFEFTYCDLYNTTVCWCDGNSKCGLPGCITAEERAMLTSIATQIPELTTGPGQVWSTNDQDALYACTQQWKGLSCTRRGTSGSPPNVMLGETVGYIAIDKFSPPYVALPVEIATLPAVANIILRGQYFNGTIPAQYGQLRRPFFYELRIEGTSLTGEIPDFNSMVNTMTYVNIKNNPGITGTINGKLKPNGYVDLSGNSLSGTIETPGFQIVLDVSNNKFTGISANYSASITAQETLIARNNLITTLPDGFFQTARTLQNLDLSGNPLSKDVLTRFGSITPSGNGALTVLRLANCSFSGPVPPEAASLASLQLLDLSNNRLNGSLPSWAMNPTNSNFSRNHFSGPIPSAGTSTNLDLSFNRLSGCFEYPSTPCSFQGNPGLCGCSTTNCGVAKCLDPSAKSFLLQLIQAIPGLESLPRPWNRSELDRPDFVDVCSISWTGISCADGITTLNFVGLNLTGSFSSAVNFSASPFSAINLGRNSFSGCLPTFNYNGACDATLTNLCGCSGPTCGLSSCVAPSAPPAVGSGPSAKAPSTGSVNLGSSISASSFGAMIAVMFSILASLI